MLPHNRRPCPHGDAIAARRWIQDLLCSGSSKLLASEALEYANGWMGGIELLFTLNEQSFSVRFGPTGGKIIQENLHRLEKPTYGFINDLISDLPLDGNALALRHWIVQVLVTRSHGDISVDDARAMVMNTVGSVVIALKWPDMVLDRLEDPYGKALVAEALDLCISTMFDEKTKIFDAKTESRIKRVLFPVINLI